MESSSRRVVLSLTCTIAGCHLSLPLVTLSGKRRKHRVHRAGHDGSPGQRRQHDTVEESPTSRNLRAALPSGIPEQLASCGEPVDWAFLERWLVARKGNVNAAVADITLHADWRRSFLGAGGVHSDEVASDLAAGKAYFQGLSLDGCPVLVLMASRFASQEMPDPLAVKRLMCFLMDRLAPLRNPQQNPLGQFRVLLDLAGLNARDMDSIYRSLLAVFEVLQQHYPQRLRRLYFLSSPILFWGIWRVLSNFVDPATRDKIVFVSSGSKGQEMLLEHIPQSILPEVYGGISPLIPVLEGITLCQSGMSPPAVPENGELTKSIQGVGVSERSFLRFSSSLKHHHHHMRARASQLEQQLKFPLGTRPLLGLVVVLLAFHSLVYWTWIRHLWQAESLNGHPSHSSLLLV